ncbi:YxeA family protein [Bacillus sp. Brlt_9]|uniref:YxeA family protein n=1 Tax=Bacillus sp. Brlt_9 TaxID=3110916 RepID=UPI003F7C2C7B
MKRYIALFSILVVFASLLAGCNLNHFGKDKYYVQITNDGIETTDKNFKYMYKVTGFDKDGKEKELEFDAQKKLRKDAFLCVYYSDEKGVSSWEEVKKDELPEKVKEKLAVK